MALYARDEYSEKHRTGPGWGFGLAWIIATVAGAVSGRALADWLPLSRLDGQFGDLAAQVLISVAIGLCIGVAQAVVLVRYLKVVGALQWVGATILGWIARVLLISLLSGILLNAILDTDVKGLLFVLYMAVMGAIGVGAGVGTGFVQRYVLDKRVAYAARWIWANIAASVLTFIAIAVDPEFGPELSILLDIAGAAITGYVLVDMLRHPTTRAEWSLQLKEKQDHISTQATESQLSPEVILEQQRKG